jgi:heme-degrading monooxygenase HmoA
MRRDGGAVGTLPRRRRQIVYARTTTMEATPSSLDAGIAYVREQVMPLLKGLDGHIGLSLLADRSSGRCILTSSWESEEAMHASGSAVQEARNRAAELFGGGNPTIEEWEIAVLHREHETGEGACVRVTWANVNTDLVDAGIEVFKAALPAMGELEGLCSASLMVNRASGRGVSSMAFDSADAVERNRADMDRLRGSVSEDAAAQILEEHDFEMMIAHLRVPELA